jgi:hypothetical protein
MRRTTTIATLATICAACAVAAPMAMGGDKFRGPVDQPFIPSVFGYSRDVPQIRIVVTYDGKTPKRLVSGSVVAKGLYGPCLAANGCKVSKVEAPQCFIGADTREFLHPPVKIKKNGRFSHTYRDHTEGATPAEVAGNFFTLTGRVNKNSITGTIQAHSYRVAEPGTTAERVETCDTGVLTYTASRGAPAPPKP